MMYGCTSQLFGFLLFIINIYNCDGVDAVLGSNATLTCPFLPGAWNKEITGDWKPLTNGQKYANVNTTQLTIINVQLADSGNYLCVSRTDGQTFNLNVIVPVNGQWTDWSGWSTCSATCGFGLRTKFRFCTNPPPTNGGSYCDGSDNQSESCYLKYCPVNGGWSNWGNWTTCSMTCGGGIWTKSRSCTNPPPASGGFFCIGVDNESGSCNTGPCPVNGEWSNWGNWTTCSMTCGGGIWTKYRSCTNRAPTVGGTCLGSENETKSCNTETCPDASQSASIIGPVAGGVSGGIVVFVLLAVVLFIWSKRRQRSTGKQNQDYETPDVAKVELHLYEERQRHNSNAIELLVHGSTSEIQSNKTFKTYNVRDFMELLQDKTSLNRNTKHEYQLLNVMAELTAAGDYEIIEVTSGTATEDASENKFLIKKKDDGYGYIIRTVPGHSDIDSFWTEITDFRARNIVLLVHKMEQISEFFPITDVSINTSKFNVELASSEKYPYNIFAFSLAVWNKDTKTEVQVKLYKTTDWKVGEKHPSIDTLCKLLDVVSDQESGLVAFLESNDISFRVCGGLGVCHEVFYAIKAERGFNIPQVAVDLKRMRPNLFQTYEEYNLCYKIICHFLENQTTYAVID